MSSTTSLSSVDGFPTPSPDYMSNDPWLTNTVSLESLQSENQRTILNLVDLLRQNNLDGIISLPQLVVCGDQSSGKSSVLEAITEIPFPRKDNLCTRFATEIILCRASTPSITTKIIADRRRPASEQSKLEAFRLSISKFDELPELIDKATELMGLGQQESGAAGGVTKAFAKDVLSIQIAGPDRPQLTLVDLPGLIHAENKTQTADDVQVVSDLVQEYISNPRTIILAVVSAKNDYANQIILKRAREVDTKGIRTLGIITKPDFLYQGSESETAFISLAKNEDIYFTLGWHVLKNLGYDERKCTFSQRNRKEESFFSKGEWAKLSPEMLGIESLRTRLSDLLFAHIKEELPALKQELEKAHADTRASLDLLGASRKSTTEQREYLMDLSLQFYNLTKAAVGGHYDAEFFSKLDAVVSPGSPSDARRLRAIVKYFSMRFSNTMQKFGGKYAFDGDQNPGIAEPDGSDDGDGDTSKSINIIGDMICRKPMPLTNDEAFEWVKRVLVRTRGQELPGNFNPLIISELFWEQSENWFSMGISHMEKVATQCEEFVALALEEISPADVSSRLQAYRTDDELAKRLEAAREEFQKILGDMKRHPITYNHNYTLAIQKMRSTQKNTSLKSSLAAITTLQRDDGSLDIDGIVAGVHDKLQPDMDKHSCNDALSCLKAFYMVALRTFVDNVIIQVVERHIVDKLEDVFSPIVIAGMDDEEIRSIASEPSNIVRQRDHLEKKMKMLDEGRKIFRSVVRRAGLE